MKAGNLSESEGSDAFWVPLYSSIYLRESHVQGNRFDLENPGLGQALDTTADIQSTLFEAYKNKVGMTGTAAGTGLVSVILVIMEVFAGGG